MNLHKLPVEELIVHLRRFSPQALVEACLMNENWILFVQDLIINDLQIEFLFLVISLKSQLDESLEQIEYIDKILFKLGPQKVDVKNLKFETYKENLAENISKLTVEKIASLVPKANLIHEQFYDFIDHVLDDKLAHTVQLTGEIRNIVLEKLVNVFLVKKQFHKAKRAAHPLPRIIEQDLKSKIQKKIYSIQDFLEIFQFDEAFAVATTIDSIRLKAMTCAEIILHEKIYHNGEILDPIAILIEKQKYDLAIQNALSIQDLDLQSVVLNDISIALIDNNPDKAIGVASMIGDLSMRDDTLFRMSKIFFAKFEDYTRGTEVLQLMTYP